MATDGPTSPAQALSTQLDESFDLLIFRWLRIFTGWLPEDIAWWLRSLVFCVIYGAVVLVVMLAAGEPRSIISVVSGVAAIILLTELILLEHAINRIKQIIRDAIAPHLSASVLETVVTNVREMLSLPRQAMFVFLLSILFAIATAPAYFSSSGQVIFIWIPVAFVIGVISFNIVYFVVLLLANVRLLGLHQADVFPLDPRHSAVIYGSASISRALLWMIAGVASVTIIGLFATVTIYSIVPAVLITIGLMLVVGVQYASQQANLSQIVARQKAITLTDLQNRLSALYQKNAALSEAEQTEFNYLLDWHDRVKMTGDSAFNVMGLLRFIAPVALPLISVISATGALPGALTDIVANLLELIR